MVLKTKAVLRTSALLRLCGFCYQKTDEIFKSRYQTKVSGFEEQLKKLIDVVQDASNTVFLAGDEAGLFLQATTCYVWSPTGQKPIVRAKKISTEL